ncbi:MAG: histidinol dehydrogenase [Kiritimatiellae bacterium]|nr:histidinol dehydrogenase [Kiritimatiellia bacterium]
MLKIVDTDSPLVERFNARPAFPEEAETAAREVLAAVRREGDAAVRRYVAKFEGFKGRDLRVAFDLKALEASIDKAVSTAVRDAHRRVMRFAKASLRAAWSIKTPRGGSEGEFYTPMDRVGVYVPGGTAPLASTSIHTVTLAKAAGVKEIVACTPAGRTGEVNPVLLYALALAGATEVYRVGGIQAVGMMAFGTKTCRKVQKIAGPGNAFVTAAKRQVYGYVAIDQVAGPSEIAVLADGSVPAKWVAADLLSQAEHGSGWEKSLCVATSRRFAEEVKAEVLSQCESLSRRDIVKRVIDRGGILIAVAKSVADGLETVNRFAPEHFEIMTKNALGVMKGVRAAGAVFAGPWTPESAGDFVAGPSHVLPTGGAANMFNGLTPDDFRRRHSFVSFTEADLAETRRSIEAFAAVEGLDAHGRAATIRFQGAAAGKKAREGISSR